MQKEFTNCILFYYTSLSVSHEYAVINFEMYILP
jgi:hypothetical protein